MKAYDFSGLEPMIHLGMDALIWVLLPVFVAAGSALLSYSIMHAKMEVAVARERATLAEAHACINTYRITMEERIRAAEEETRRKALNEFMQDFRVEERHYVRENKSSSNRRKTMVLQERLYFRNIPLSNWVEHEMTMEDYSDPNPVLAEAASAFRPRALALPDEPVPTVSARLLA
ncbi:MAG: hypothetical protein JO022_01320 [Acidobacteriaceae bacterium]|nr:hypothetical protein [Acidobacteriaceae bacterium]